ncbi:hypothetical protein BURK_005332 [Burkholderia sp. SJ98]|uniref:hypothetical protein n=1 Tax=Caballeronia zhejiangensis TaxID=871203 RepID=UPI00025BB601|nr:hypothetical protein [Caballeronia zhejiangensis]EKS72437.1 hypothetical protein BURK_005332 [Burkholderia sp. SJ98]
MGIPKDDASADLVAVGFQLLNSSGFGDSYEKVLPNGWKITAFGSFVGNAFLGNVMALYEDFYAPARRRD